MWCVVRSLVLCGRVEYHRVERGVGVVERASASPTVFGDQSTVATSAKVFVTRRQTVTHILHHGPEFTT